MKNPSQKLIPASVGWLATLGGALLVGMAAMWIVTALVLISMKKPDPFQPLPKALSWELRR